MKKLTKVLNTLMVEIFNDILTIEQTALKKGHFSDLSVTEMHTIEAIGMYHPRTMSEVALDLKITVGTLTTAINRLVKKGYVERKRVEDDRRVVKIQLTKKGKLAYRIHEKFHTDMIHAMIEGLNVEDEEILVKSLSQLSNYLKKHYHLNE
ncbi:MarR family winged helix-turn-helix transcriptional regulator [Defluviitalea phaphyphila]|uniref:MarR family winged helix-turn-helix transcriptional regulator n=1 Tax=Defluviitalea phaphyphila TaxID=1473580 RepID=UPI0007316D8B|nr:MarR family transcriptional regulator [Defluviitalea phaphyphila]